MVYLNVNTVSPSESVEFVMSVSGNPPSPISAAIFDGQVAVHAVNGGCIVVSSTSEGSIPAIRKGVGKHSVATEAIEAETEDIIVVFDVCWVQPFVDRWMMKWAYRRQDMSQELEGLSLLMPIPHPLVQRDNPDSRCRIYFQPYAAISLNMMTIFSSHVRSLTLLAGEC